MKPQRVISAMRGYGSTLLRTMFELFFQEFCYENHRLIQKRWESAKKFLFWEAKWNHVFFWSAFESTLLKHAGEVFFLFCVMQTF